MTQMPFNFDDLPQIPLDPSGTVILLLKRSKLGETRSLRSLVKLDPAIEDRVNKDFLSMIGKIYSSPELKAIERLDAQLTFWIARRALPSILRTGSTWILPLSLIPSVDQKLAETVAIREQLIQALITQFDRRVNEAREQLGPIADQFNWLTSREVASSFAMSWRYMTLGVPSALEAFDPLLYEREKARMLSDLQDQKNLILQAIYEQAMEGLARFESNLDVNDKTGKPKRFNDSALDNLVEFLELLPQRQLVPAPQFEALMARTRDVLNGITPKVIRAEGMAQNLRTQVASIIDGLTDVTGLERPSRKITFDEDDDPPVVPEMTLQDALPISAPNLDAVTQQVVDAFAPKLDAKDFYYEDDIDAVNARLFAGSEPPNQYEPAPNDTPLDNAPIVNYDEAE